MSINTLPTNTSVLKKLGQVLPEYLPSSEGITALQGDTNITASVVGQQGNISLNGDIEINNLTLNDKIILNGNTGIINQVLTSQGNSAPLWLDVSTPSLSGLMKYIVSNTYQLSINGPSTDLQVFTLSLSGFTVGKTIVINATATLYANGPDPNPVSFQLC